LVPSFHVKEDALPETVDLLTVSIGKTLIFGVLSAV
jgi:hypothetical protein